MFHFFREMFRKRVKTTIMGVKIPSNTPRHILEMIQVKISEKELLLIQSWIGNASLHAQGKKIDTKALTELGHFEVFANFYDGVQYRVAIEGILACGRHACGRQEEPTYFFLEKSENWDTLLTIFGIDHNGANEIKMTVGGGNKDVPVKAINLPGGEAQIAIEYGR